MTSSACPIAVNTKILSFPTTGAQRYLLEILARLPEERLQRIAPGRTLSGMRGHAWEQFVLPIRLPRAGLLWSPSISGPLWVRNQVVTIFDIAPLDHPEWFRSTFFRFWQFLVPRLARRARHIITISQFTKQRIVALCDCPPEKISVTLLAADARFNPGAADPGRLASLALPTPRYVLALGSIEPRKNVPALLQAWGRVVDQVPADITLVIAGGKGRSSIFSDVTLGSLPPRVHFTGHVPEEILPALLSGALTFCYPSVYEGFGLPPLEAMACGVPVLTGNLTALPEVVGDAGLAVDPTSVDALSDGLLRLISDAGLRSVLRARGLDRARLFSWDLAAERTWEILSHIAAPTSAEAQSPPIPEPSTAPPQPMTASRHLQHVDQ